MATGPRLGRPWCLPLADRVLVVAVYYRTSLTMRQLAPLFGISPATVCRVIQRLRPSSRSSRSPVRSMLRTGCGSWTARLSRCAIARSVHRAATTGFPPNVQVIIDADTRLVVAAAPQAPGNKADAHVWRNSGLPQQCQGVTVLGDGAYINTGLVVPHRKRPGRPLLAGEEAHNAEHRRVRARVEHAIGRLKNYKILRDCRQHGERLHHAVRAVAHMHNLALAS